MVTFLRDNIFTWFQFSGSSTWLAAVPSCLIVVTVTRLHIPTKLFIGTFYMVKTKIFRPSFYCTSIKIKQKTRPETHWLFCLPVHYIFSKYIYLYLFPRLFFLKRVQSLFEKYKFTLIILNSINEDRPKLFIHIPILSFWFSQGGGGTWLDLM